MALIANDGVTAFVAAGAAAGLAAAALASAVLVGGVARGALGAERRQRRESVDLFFTLTAAAAATVALLARAAALQAGAAYIAGAQFVAAAGGVQRIILEFARAPPVTAPEAANLRRQEEVTRRAAPEADLARKNDEIRRANETLIEAMTALPASEGRLTIAVEAGGIGL